MEDQVKKILIVKFNEKRDEDLYLWCTYVEAYLVSRSVMDVARDDISGTTEDIDMVEKKFFIAPSVIIQASEDKPVRTVMTENKKPSVMWSKFQERYDTATGSTRVQLMIKLHQMNDTTSISISEYVDYMESLFNRLEAIDCQIQESMKEGMLFASFGDNSLSPYAPVVAALETLSDDKLTWDTATSCMLQEYDSRQIHSSLERGGTKDVETQKKFVSDMNFMAQNVGPGFQTQCQRFVLWIWQERPLQERFLGAEKQER